MPYKDPAEKKLYQADYYKRKREEILDTNKKWASRNQERRKTQMRNWRGCSRRQIRGSIDAWLRRNPGKKEKHAAKYRSTHREPIRHASKRWYAVNKKRHIDNKRAYRLSKLGLTVVEYDKMLSAQGGVCAICGKKEKTGRRLSVDHCHRTGKVRGLLCHMCNKGLGAFGDDRSLLKRALSYLGGR